MISLVRLGALIVGTLGRTFRKSSPDLAVILMTGPEGSLGDTAMADVLLQELKRSHALAVVLLGYTHADTHCAIIKKTENASAMTLTQLALRPWSLVKLVSRTRLLRFIGADVVDGAYGRRNALLRLAVFEAFAVAGANCGIVSFSISDRPDKRCMRVLKDLSTKAQLVVRDPVSFRRLEGRLPGHLIQGADLAFLLKAEGSPAGDAFARTLHQLRSRGDLLIGICWNALIYRADDTSVCRKLSACISKMLDDSPRTSIVLLPHDVRNKTSDVELCRRVIGVLPGRHEPRVWLFRGEVTPQEVKFVIGTLDALVSARMHAAIAAASQGIPVFGLTYQGKFEGLFEHLRLHDALEIISTPANRVLIQPIEVAGMIMEFVADRERYSRHIRKQLGHIRNLSRRNV